MVSESPATREHTYAYSLRTAYTIGDFAAFHWIVFVRGQATAISAGGGAYNDTLRRPPLPITVSARGPQGNTPLWGDGYCSRCHDAHILFVRKSHRFCVWSAEEEASLLSHEGMKERGIYEKLRLWPASSRREPHQTLKNRLPASDMLKRRSTAGWQVALGGSDHLVQFPGGPYLAMPNAEN